MFKLGSGSESHLVTSNSLRPHGLCSQPGSSVHGIYRQEYWSGLPRPPPGDLPDPGIKPQSPALQADSLPSEPPRKPKLCTISPYLGNINTSQ